jgi:hypothetical protein
VKITGRVLANADIGGHESVLDILCTNAVHRQSLRTLCFGSIVTCMKHGILVRMLRAWEARSAWTLLLSVKRTQSLQISARVSDVLRTALDEYARFDVLLVTDTERDRGTADVTGL